jgi:hypothetical protein
LTLGLVLNCAGTLNFLLVDAKLIEADADQLNFLSAGEVRLVGRVLSVVGH